MSVTETDDFIELADTMDRGKQCTLQYVMKGGQWHDAGALIQQAQGRIGPASEDELSEWMPDG